MTLSVISKNFKSH